VSIQNISLILSQELVCWPVPEDTSPIQTTTNVRPFVHGVMLICLNTLVSQHVQLPSQHTIMELLIYAYHDARPTFFHTIEYVIQDVQILYTMLITRPTNVYWLVFKVSLLLTLKSVWPAVLRLLQKLLRIIVLILVSICVLLNLTAILRTIFVYITAQAEDLLTRLLEFVSVRPSALMDYMVIQFQADVNLNVL